MGLLLSVLVACVGVVELLAFCSKITRSFATISTQTDLDQVSTRYLEGLEKRRRDLQQQILIAKRNLETNAEATTQDFYENIRLEYAGHVVVEKCRSTSPTKALPKFFIKEENGTPKHFTEHNQSEENEQRPRSPSPIPKRLGEEDIAFRRSPSPYPFLVLPVPRNSICSELLDNPAASVVEVDEELLSRSPTPLKFNDSAAVPNTNEILDETKKSLEVLAQTSESCVARKSNDEILDETKEYDTEFLDSLDGVKKKKLSRSSSLRWSRKKKSLSSSLSTESDDCLSSPSKQNNDIAKTLTEAANVLKNVNREAADGGTSGKSPEPFWVNT